MLPRVKTCATGVRQLHVDDALFVPKVGQQFGGKRTDSVKGQFYAVISASAQGNGDGGYVNGAFRRTDAGEQQGAMTGVFLQFPENLYGLRRERHNMLMFRRHALRGDNPESAGEIKFVPFGTAQFTGTDEQQGN